MSIELITEQSLTEGVADRWLAQYQGELDTTQCLGRTPRKVHEELLGLGDNPSKEDIDKIIGNDSWTRVPECSNCDREENKYLVSVGIEELCGVCVQNIAEISEGLDI